MKPNPLFGSEARRCWAALVAARQRRRRHPWRPTGRSRKSAIIVWRRV